MSFIRTLLGIGPPSYDEGMSDGFTPEMGAFSSAFRSLSKKGGGPPAAIGTVNAIIAVISQTCGQLPRQVLENGNMNRTPVTDPRLDYLTRKPNAVDAMSGNAFWEAMFASAEGWGDGFAWQDRIGPEWYDVLGLFFLMPQRVEPFPDKNRVQYHLDGNEDKRYGPDEILHVAKGMFDGVKGMSPVREGAITHELTKQAERTALSFFRRGATVGGVVSHPEQMNKPEVDELYRRFRRLHAGGDRVGNMLLLTGNAKYEKIGIPPNEAQFLETRQFQREEILSWYAPGMPHHLLGWKSSASNWGTGVEAQSIAFVKYVLLSRLRRMEEMVNERLLPAEFRFQFSVEELMRGDSKVRAEVMGKMRQQGVLSADEWRTREGMPPRGIPDDFLQPLNMDRINRETGEFIKDSNTGQPIAPVAATHLVGELRCRNDECRSRANGKPGALLGRKIGQGEIRCHQCGETTVLKARETIRDIIDLSEAIDVELTKRMG